MKKNSIENLIKILKIKKEKSINISDDIITKNIKTFIDKFPEEGYLLEEYQTKEDGRKIVLEQLENLLLNTKKIEELSWEQLEKDMFGGIIEYRKNKDSYDEEAQVRMEFLNKFFVKCGYISAKGTGKGFGQAGDKLSDIIKEIKKTDSIEKESLAKIEILENILKDIRTEMVQMINNINKYKEQEFDQIKDIFGRLKEINQKTKNQYREEDEVFVQNIEKEMKNLFKNSKKKEEKSSIEIKR